MSPESRELSPLSIALVKGWTLAAANAGLTPMYRKIINEQVKISKEACSKKAKRRYQGAAITFGSGFAKHGINFASMLAYDSVCKDIGIPECERNFIVPIMSGFTGAFFANPLTVLKTRVYTSENGTSVLRIMLDIPHGHRLRTAFSGSFATIAYNGLGFGSTMATFRVLDSIWETKEAMDVFETALREVMTTTTAGVASVIVGNPFARVAAIQKNAPFTLPFGDVCASIYKQEGVRGFFKQATRNVRVTFAYAVMTRAVDKGIDAVISDKEHQRPRFSNS